MPEFRLIALTGRAGAGKDSAAAALVQARAYQSIAFADALREEVVRAWRIDHRMLTEPATKELPVPALAIGMCGLPSFVLWCSNAGHRLDTPRSPRWIMQQWGTWQRLADPARYVQAVVRWINRQRGVGHTRFVVTDMRMPNEHAEMQRLGAKVVRVHRPDHDLRRLEGDTATHESERHQCLPADADLLNGGSLAALADNVLALESDLFGGAP